MTLPRDELERVAGALYDALLEARPYIRGAVELARDANVPEAIAAREQVLEAIDGALADAGELVGLGGRLRAGERGRAT